MDAPAPGHSRSRSRRAVMFAVLTLLVFPFLLWAAGAIYFDLPLTQPWRSSLAVLWLISAVLGPLVLKPRMRTSIAVGCGFLLILAWWLLITPRNDRNWQPDVSRVARATVDGDRVTFENVRNNDYRTEHDYDARWETRAYNLADLRGVDAFLTTWGSPYMAHPILSFDFGPGGRVCFSIETRKENGESYSALGGLYRRYELIYVVADERDVIRLRTNYRNGEEVYRYRFNIPIEAARSRFNSYVRRLNELADEPEFYNAVLHNCTTSIRMQTAPSERIPFDYRLLLNGTIDELLYERGIIDHSEPFATIKARAHINARARAADADPDFSDRIRNTESDTR